MNLPQQYRVIYGASPIKQNWNILEIYCKKILSNQIKIQKHPAFEKIPTKIEN